MAAYFGYQQHARTAFEDMRREESAASLRDQSVKLHENATQLNQQADVALDRGLTLQAEHLRGAARSSSIRAQEELERAARVAVGELPPAVIEVTGADWVRINDDVGNLVSGGIETDDRSLLTGEDRPPAVNRSRPYDVRGGLRRPLGVHQKDLERAMPRDGAGRVVRQADPREGTWFSLANDGGPAADPTRGINCVDGVLSLFDTYVHGRPRVSAPRTFDSYAYGDTNRPLGPEVGGIARIEQVAQGHFATLTPRDPADPRRAVDDAMHHLMGHLWAKEHGSFAFIVTQNAAGDAHAWAAVNHHGTILFLDPQTGKISEDVPLYRQNVISVSALVTDPDGGYSSPPRNEATRPGNPPDPTGPGPADDREPSDLTPEEQAEREAFDSLDDSEQAALLDARQEAIGIANRVWENLDEVVRGLRGDGDLPDLVGTEYRVKSEFSLARAYVDTGEFGRAPIREFIDSTKDLIRFSVRVPEVGYGEAVRSILASLEGLHYRVNDKLSFWGPGGRHNGLNVTLTEPSGRLVEVQFPTPLSWSLGKDTHRLYETVRNPRFGIAKRVDAFLRILVRNKEAGINTRQPAGLHLLDGLRVKDSSLRKFASSNPKLWRDLESTQDVREMIKRYGLDPDELLGPSDDGGSG